MALGGEGEKKAGACVPERGACFHCGQTAAELLHETFGTAELGFCCRGCLAVCRYIFDAGLEGYYEKRDGSKSGRPPLFPAQDFNVDDSPELVKSKGDIKEASLIVEGIHCAACIWLIEKVVGKMPGVIAASLNFSTHRMVVQWDGLGTTLGKILAKITSLGYGATPYDAEGSEIPLIKKNNDVLIRLVIAGFGTVATMFFAEGLYAGYFWGIESNFRNFLQWASLIVTIPVVFYSGTPFITGAYHGLINRAMTMDMPVALGALITFFYSAWATVAGRGDVYFDSVAMFVSLILLGRYLEAAAKKKAGIATARLISLDVDAATVIRDGARVTVPVKAVRVGEVLEVKPGERIPLDGIMTEGESRIDESMLTGESKPVGKRAGAKVYGATKNMDGAFLFRVTDTGKDTVYARITRLVEEAQMHKARIQRISDRIAGYFVPFILIAAALTYLYWSVYSPSHAVIYAVAVLIITCPCALALATPAAILVGGGAAAREGILVKNGEVMEKAYKTTHVIFDKTGTLTEGRMTVTDIIPVCAPACAISTADRQLTGRPAMSGASPSLEEDLLAMAASVEQFSEHPIGRAIFVEATKRSVSIDREVEGFRAYPGRGVEGVLNRPAGKAIDMGRPSGRVLVLAGSRNFMAERSVGIRQELAEKEQKLNSEGKTAVYIASSSPSDTENLKLSGLIAVSDPPRPQASVVVEELKGMGLKVTMLSGDNRTTAEAVAKTIGMDDLIAEVLPEAKEGVIRDLQKDGDVIVMVGDGINDGPALARADVGIAMGSGTDVAIGSADIVLLNSNPLMVARAIEISQKTFKAIRQNLWLSFFYNIIFTPLAVTGFIVPVVAAVAMPLSSLIVIGNSMRVRMGRRVGKSASAGLKDRNRSRLSVNGSRLTVAERR